MITDGAPGRQPVAVLFVCLGNICRSPSAHGVFRRLVEREGLDASIVTDSAGTGDWHIGKPPDRRATAAAAARGVDIADLRARQVDSSDLDRFDYVLAMDAENLADLQAMAREATAHEGMRRAQVRLFSDFSRAYRGEPVPDPYFGGERGFEQVLDMIEDAASGLLAEIRRQLE